MTESLIDWLMNHWIELTGAITSLLYVFCSVRQSIWAWPLNITASLIYMLVFAQNSIYANMSLQGYFVLMGIYGWYYWLKGGKPVDGNVTVQLISRKVLLLLSLATPILFFALWLILKNTPSPVPVADSFTTTLSIIGTWLLARKILENWLVWIVVDLVSVTMYADQQLWLTAALYLVFVVMAISGYLQWKKSLQTAS